MGSYVLDVFFPRKQLSSALTSLLAESGSPQPNPEKDL